MVGAEDEMRQRGSLCSQYQEVVAEAERSTSRERRRERVTSSPGTAWDGIGLDSLPASEICSTRKVRLTIAQFVTLVPKGSGLSRAYIATSWQAVTTGAGGEGWSQTLANSSF